MRRACRECGAEFEAKSRSQVFHSPECRRKAKFRRYYWKNRERLARYNASYRSANQQYLRGYFARYRSDNAGRIREYRRQYYAAYREYLIVRAVKRNRVVRADRARQCVADELALLWSALLEKLHGHIDQGA